MARTTHMLLAGLQIVHPPQGRIQYFFRRGCTSLLSTSTPINHIVLFFLRSTSCIRKLQVRGGGAHLLHPPRRYAPAPLLRRCWG